MKDQFLELKDVLVEPEQGLRIVGRHLIPAEPMPERPLPALREDYLSAVEAEAVKQHNLRWANGLEEKPKLLLAWLMLPTRCNQWCRGCYAGNDKKKTNSILPQFYSEAKLKEMLDSLRRHGARTIGYAGLGELFTMRRPHLAINAREYIERIIGAGFNMLIFTNGTLLSVDDIEWLAKRPISLIFSLRDIVESEHNGIVRFNGFRKTLRALELALRAGLHKANRIGVEIPVIHGNMERVLNDFIPAMRHLGIIPYAEQYMQVCTSSEEKKMGLSFAEAREFFRRAQAIERRFGYVHAPCFAQRMVSQDKCIRPVFSVTIYPNGAVTPCPGNSEKLGNIYDVSLDEILNSDKYREWVKRFELCACSVFYTESDKEIPPNMPQFLEEFK